MRDLFAALVALALVFVAASLATTLRAYRGRRRLARDAERARGRTIIAELPTSDELVIVSEDDERLYYGLQAIEKASMTGVRVLINGSPIASFVSARRAPDTEISQAGFTDHVEGIARDRWDVAIETTSGPVLVECGAIRERVSQELARAIFDAVRRALEAQDRAAGRA